MFKKMFLSDTCASVIVLLYIRTATLVVNALQMKPVQICTGFIFYTFMGVYISNSRFRIFMFHFLHVLTKVTFS